MSHVGRKVRLAREPGEWRGGSLPSRPADELRDHRLVGPARTFVVHVACYLGRRWVAANRNDMQEAGVDVRELLRTLGMPGMASAVTDDLGVDTEIDLDSLIVDECLRWVRVCARLGSTRKPSFDVFLSEDEFQNGDRGLGVTVSPRPPSAWGAALSRRLRIVLSNDACVVHNGGRPALAVRGGRAAHYWLETPEFRDRASRLRREILSKVWRRQRLREPLPPDPYAMPHDAYRSRLREERMATRRDVDAEMSPLFDSVRRPWQHQQRHGT